MANPYPLGALGAPQATPHTWWGAITRGVVAIIFGVLALVLPPILSILALTLLFGVYAMIDGAVAIASAVGRVATPRRTGWLLFEGIVSIAAGLIALFFTTGAALALLYLIAAWAIVTGVFEILQAVELRRMIHNELALIIGGALSVIFGVLIAIFPSSGFVAVIWLIGIYAILFGITQIGLGIRLRRMRRSGGPLPTSAY